MYVCMFGGEGRALYPEGQKGREETRRPSNTQGAVLEVFKKRTEKNIIAKSSTPGVWCAWVGAAECGGVQMVGRRLEKCCYIPPPLPPPPPPRSNLRRYTDLQDNGKHARTPPCMEIRNNGTKSITFHSKETKGENVRRFIEV